MANVFSSRVHGDPFTPILKTYEKDRVKVRLIQGAQEEEHVFSANGLKWLHEPSEPLSGWYNAQAIGISEHFEMVTPVPAECPATRRFEPWDLDVETVATMDALYPEGDVGFSSPSIAEEVRVATEERLAAEVDSIWPCDLTAATTETVNRLTASESMVDDIREGLSTESLYTEDTSATGMAAMAATGETSYVIGGGTATSYTCNRRHRCFSDYLYGSTPLDDLWNGMWGILRGWRERRADVRELPNNPRPSSFLPQGPPPVTGLPSLPPNAGETDPCAGQTVTGYPVLDVHAIAKPITYNPRVGINDPTGLLFAPAADANAILAGTKAPEPLVMRAKGGECLTVRLKNRLPGPVPDRALQDAPMPGITTLNVDGLSPSRRVSMHPQLVEMNVRTGDGSQVGFNPNQTAGPNQTITYRWYVPVNLDASSDPFTQPLLPGPESLGGTNLRDFGDVIKHGSQGLFGGLMLEPAGASFANRFHNSEVVTKSDGTWFREFVLFYQDGLNLWDRNDMWIPDMPGRRGMNPSLRADPEDSGSKGFNYKTEPFWARLCPGLPLGSCNFAAFDLNDVDQSDVLSSFPYWGDPATPVFHAYPGDPFRFRLLQPDGRARQHSWAIHGHEWPHEPSHPKSMSLGAQGGISVARHFNVVPFQGAGGLTRTVGSYLYRDMPSFQFSGGLWGILRVDPFDPCVVDPASCDPCVVDPASCDPCAMDPALCDPTPCQVGRICYVY